MLTELAEPLGLAAGTSQAGTTEDPRTLNWSPCFCLPFSPARVPCRIPVVKLRICQHLLCQAWLRVLGLSWLLRVGCLVLRGPQSP